MKEVFKKVYYLHSYLIQSSFTFIKVYIVIQHENKYQTFKLMEESSWPPSEQEIMSRIVDYPNYY